MEHILVAKNTVFQVLARGATAFVGFLVTIIVAKTFGVAGYGDFIKVTSFVAMFYLVVDFGLNAFFLQEEKANFKNLFYLRILLSACVFIAINIISYFLPFNGALNTGFSNSVKIGILFFSLTVFFQGAIYSASAIFQKNLNYYPYMLGVVIGSAVNLAAVFLFAFLNFSIFYIFLAFLISNFVSAFLLVFFTKEKIFPVLLDKIFSKKLLTRSIPLSLMLVFNLIYFRVDIFLLALLKGTTDVGVYGLSYKFFDFLIALPLFMSNAIYPILIKQKQNKELFFKSVGRYFLLFLAISVIVIIPFWFVSPLFKLISAGFYDSIVPFRILLLSLPFFFTTSFLQWVLITLQKQKYLMYVYVFSAFVNIVLNILFIPRFSYIASSTITVFSEALVFLFLSYKILTVKKISETE